MLWFEEAQLKAELEEQEEKAYARVEKVYREVFDELVKDYDLTDEEYDNFLQSAHDNINADELKMTDEELRDLYHGWLKDGLEELKLWKETNED